MCIFVFETKAAIALCLTHPQFFPSLVISPDPPLSPCLCFHKPVVTYRDFRAFCGAPSARSSLPLHDAVPVVDLSSGQNRSTSASTAFSHPRIGGHRGRDPNQETGRGGDRTWRCYNHTAPDEVQLVTNMALARGLHAREDQALAAPFKYNLVVLQNLVDVDR